MAIVVPSGIHPICVSAPLGPLWKLRHGDASIVPVGEALAGVTSNPATAARGRIITITQVTKRRARTFILKRKPTFFLDILGDLGWSVTAWILDSNQRLEGIG